jgi:hypothetical protein
VLFGSRLPQAGRANLKIGDAWQEGQNMAAMNVGGAITPAIEHTGRVLFRPFALRKWLALGLVSILAEAGGGGGGGGDFSSSDWSRTGDASRMMVEWIVGHILLIVVGCAALFVIGLALMWLGSVLKFVYLNQITRDPYAIRAPFGRFIGLGTSYFLWQLAFGLALLLAIGTLVVLPILAVFLRPGGASAYVAPVIAIIWAVIVGGVLIVCWCVIDIFARDFAVTAMFVRGVGIMEGWRTVLPILRANVGQSVLYLLMLIVIAIAVGIGSVIVVLVVAVGFLIPGGLLALIGYAIYSAGGFSALLIGYIVLMGLALLCAFIYIANCAVQPFMVFRRTFALVVLGQAEPSLATVPVSTRSAGYPPPPGE